MRGGGGGGRWIENQLETVRPYFSGKVKGEGGGWERTFLLDPPLLTARLVMFSWLQS